MAKSKTFTINKKTNYVGSITFTSRQRTAAKNGRVSRINVTHAKTGKHLATITNVVTVAKGATRIPLRDAQTNEFVGMSSFFVAKY